MAGLPADGSTDHLRILALDLGTTMTRFCEVGVGQVVSHPTLLLRDRRGRPVAAGWPDFRRSQAHEGLILSVRAGQGRAGLP
jgi:hypothetical protein